MSHGTSFIPQLIDNLIEKDAKRLFSILENLIEENYKLGNPQHGFLFHGEFCTTLPKKQRAGVTKKLLHPELHDQGRAYFKEVDLVIKEAKRLHQGLTILLRDCHTDQDVRDALPDVVSPLIPAEITQLDRTRPEAWPIRDQPLKFHDYEILLDLMCFYVANRILY